MAQFNDDALWGAVKRKNVQDVLAFVFTECGYDAAAEVAKSTTRMTDQAITRMREALDAPLGNRPFLSGAFSFLSHNKKEVITLFR